MEKTFFLTWFSFFRTRSFQGFRKRILQGDSTLKASWHAKCFSYIIVLAAFIFFKLNHVPQCFLFNIIFWIAIHSRAQESGAEIGSVLGLVPTEPTDPCKVGIGRAKRIFWVL